MAELSQGYTILHQHKTPKAAGTLPGRVIMVDRGPGFQRYVTAWIADGESSWCWGHYFDDRESAAKDFQQRKNRGF